MEIGEAPKPYEILHVGEYDVVINNTADDPESIRGLVEKLKDDIKGNRGPLNGWVQDNFEERISLDKKDNPTFIAKERGMTTSRRASFIDTDKEFSDSEEWRSKEKRRYDTFNSLVNEISLSRSIKFLIENDDAQKIVKRHGYQGIKFVEPLIGLIDRKSGKKILIYKFFKGVAGATTNTSLVARDLREYFDRRGILADDLSEEQFITAKTPKGNVLYLIDVEGYRRIHTLRV